MELTFETQTLLEALPDTPGTSFDFTASYTDIEGTAHSMDIFDTDFFVSEVIHNYRHRKLDVIANDSTYLADLFAHWKDSRGGAYAKVAFFLAQKYDALSDNAMTEIMTNDQKVTQHGEKIKRQYASNVETDDNTHNEITMPDTLVTETPADYTTESRSSFDASALTDVNKSTRGGYVTTQQQYVDGNGDPTKEIEVHLGTIKNTHSGYDEDSHSGSDTETRNYTLTKNGITQAPAELMQKEYNSLLMDLAKEALEEFVNRYTYFYEGV